MRSKGTDFHGVMLVILCSVSTLFLSGCSPNSVLDYLDGCKNTNTIHETQSSISPSVVHSSNSTVESYVVWAEGIASDQSHGYSQARRNSQVDYDCSSLVWFALKHAGFNLGTGWPFTTLTMGTVLEKHGFQHFTWSGNMGDAQRVLQRGDVVVNTSSHTEIYRGGGSFVGARHAYPSGIEDDHPGDQGTGSHEEIGVGPTSAGMVDAYRFVGTAPITVPVDTSQSTTQKTSYGVWECVNSTSDTTIPIDVGSIPDGRHATPQQAQVIAKQMISRYPEWNSDDFDALVWIWNHESGWRWNAENPSSGAYGIPQSLPGTKMMSAGVDWHDNAATQIKWGLDYIKQRYGSPTRAKAFWQSHHWY